VANLLQDQDHSLNKKSRNFTVPAFLFKHLVKHVTLGNRPCSLTGCSGARHHTVGYYKYILSILSDDSLSYNLSNLVGAEKFFFFSKIPEYSIVENKGLCQTNLKNKGQAY
jgi:hypothetical protein